MTLPPPCFIYTIYTSSLIRLTLMQLDQNIITQLQGLFANLKHQYTLVVDNAGDAKSE